MLTSSCKHCVRYCRLYRLYRSAHSPPLESLHHCYRPEGVRQVRGGEEEHEVQRQLQPDIPAGDNHNTEPDVLLGRYVDPASSSRLSVTVVIPKKFVVSSQLMFTLSPVEFYSHVYLFLSLFV